MEEKFFVGSFKPKQKTTKKYTRKPEMVAPAAPKVAADQNSTINPSPSSIPPPQLPPGFNFEVPVEKNVHVLVDEGVVFAPNSITLNLPCKAWESVCDSLHSIKDVGRTALVCRSWKISVATSVKVATLTTAEGVRIKQLRAIAPNIETLVLSEAEAVTCCGIEDLHLLSKLKELKILSSAAFSFPTSKTGTSSIDKHMVEFCLLAPHLPPTLQALYVPMARISKNSLAALSKLRLTHLDLSKGDWRADDWNWAPLADNPEIDDWVEQFPKSLEVLNLSHCHVLSDRMLKKFKRLPKLRVLDLENCFQLTDVGIASLPSSIEKLNLAQCISVFRKGDAKAGVIPSNLSLLKLSFNFNDHFVAYLPNTLTALLLEKSYVTDNGMKVILGMLKNLVELSCAACINVGNATLEVLPATVRTLDLWHNRNITDEGLKSLKSVEVLDVTNSQKLTCKGILEAIVNPPFRVLAIGSVFVPENVIERVAVIRDPNGIYGHRPKLFIK